MLISGFDTETYNGYVKLITCTVYDTDSNKSVQSYLEKSDTLSLLDFVYSHSIGSEYAVFYNINYDISAILKPFIIENALDLRKKFYQYIELNKEYKELMNKTIKNKADFSRIAYIENQMSENKPLTFNVSGYKVSIISGKSVSIKPDGKKKHTVNVFDVANFYRTNHDGFMTLDYASQKYLGEQKNNEALEIDRKAIGEQAGYYERYREKIIKYGLQDSYLTAKLLAYTIKSYQNININFPKKPYSKASISRQYLKDNYLTEYMESQKSYTAYDTIADFKKFYSGGYFRVFAVGSFNNVVNRDIRSAYPYAISHLYSLKDSKLIMYDEPDFKDADYTFYQIETNYTPLLQTRLGNSIYYIDSENSDCIDAKCKHTYYITGLDKEILDLSGTEYKIVKAYGLITTKNLIFPNFSRLYDNKAEIKKKYGGESGEYMNIKIVMNGFYGILAQSKPFITKYTNYVYASYITAWCRNTILKELFTIEKEQEVIQISTDSIMYSELKPVHYPTGEKLGDIEQERYDTAIIYGSGLYVYTQGNERHVRRRGFSNIDFTEYEDITENYIRTEHSRPTHIMEAIIQQIPSKIANFKLEKKIFNPVKALSEKYNVNDISSWTFLDFKLRRYKVKCYKIWEVVKNV